ncbi:MAG: hypothetical protein J0H01_06280 [Rhizobiales bacterium]|nr:hypothetical protein [Hyphomicrobiales bacterium]
MDRLRPIKLWQQNALFICLGLAACFLLNGFQSIRFGDPASISDDHLFLLVEIKRMLTGASFRYEPKLGFPGVRDQMLFPLFDGSYRLIIWMLTFTTSNIFLIVDRLYLIGVGLIFISSYIALRKLDFSPWLSCFGSIAFAITPYFVVRAYSHDHLALYFSVPLGALLPFLLAKAETVEEMRRSLFGPFAIVVLVIVATSGLYYAFFTAMFVMLTGVAQSFARRRLAPLLLAAAFCAALVVVLLVAGYRAAVLDIMRGQMHSPWRAPFEQLYHGMLLSTAMHVYSELGLWTRSFNLYRDAISSPGLGFVSGEAYLFEWPGVVLTTTILVSPAAFLLGRVFNGQDLEAARPQSRQAAILFWLPMMLITFGIIFSIRGGLGYIFNHIVDGTIRSQERVLPFLTFFAIVIFCSVAKSIWNFRKTIGIRWLSAFLTLALMASLLPSVGGLANKRNALDTAEGRANLKSVADMLTVKTQAGLTAILQLPYLAWPEAHRMEGFVPYQHQLPYLLDADDSPSRWSYGLTVDQPTLDAVRSRLDLETAPDALPERARGLGFDGMLIEKAAYPARDVAALIDAIERDGSSCKLYDDRYRVLFVLTRNSSGAACARR